MIKCIRLENFRCFENTTISFTDINIVVGKNNAGKSTVVEALRIISLISYKFRKSVYENPPASLNLPVGSKVLIPSLKYLNINFDTIIYKYDDPPAKITVWFTTNEKFIIYIKQNICPSF